MSNQHQNFGFLIHPIEGKFSGGSLSPLENHREILSIIKEISDDDGYIYPPSKTKEKTDHLNNFSSAYRVYSLPHSHQLIFDSPIDTSNSTHSDTALITYLLSYLYGTRLQFNHLRFEGRIPLKSTNNIYFSEEICLDFLGHTYNWWKSQSSEIRMRFVNILYVLTRARSLLWDWDEFVYQYMVFDAIYKLHTELNPKASKAKNHKDRFNSILSSYEIRINDILIDKIHNNRNDLFHEALWGRDTIGFDHEDQGNYLLPKHLGRLNSRLICGLVGYKNNYLKSVWWNMGKYEFDKNLL